MADEEPFYVVVTGVQENPDGAATYSFEMSDDAAEKLANLGLEFTLYCASYGLDLQYVLDNIGLISDKFKAEETTREKQ